MKKRIKKLHKPRKAKKSQKTKKAVEDTIVVSEDDIEILPSKSSQSTAETKSDSSKALVPYDALTAYLKEIRQYPPLSREREKELALQYHQNKDIKAAYELVSSNLWLVVKIAKEYERRARNLIDLIQEGNIGLMEAVKNFDPYRGVRFPSYAVWWIKAYIIRYVIANLRMVKIGTTQAQRKLFFNLQKEKEKLKKAGFYPGPKLLAEKLEVKESDVVEMEQRLSSPDLSVDAPLSDESDASLLSVMPTDDMSVEDIVADKQIKEIVAQGIDDFMGILNEKEHIIFKERILSDDKATLQKLSDKLDISRERVRQIETKIKDKFKNFFTEKFGHQMEKLQ